MVPRVKTILDSLGDDRARLERFARSLTQVDLSRSVPGSTWTVKDFNLAGPSRRRHVDQLVSEGHGLVARRGLRGPSGEPRLQ